MEITSFILGVCAVIVLMMVVGTFVNYLTTKSLKKEITDLQKQLEYTQMDLEKKESQLYDFGNNIDRNRIDEQEKIYRHIDSRVDKSVDGMSKHVSELYRLIDEQKLNKTSIING